MIKGKGIHYVIVVYFGRRRAEYAPHVRDRLLFLQRHLESLVRVKHSIDRITLAVQVDDDGISTERTDAIAATCKLLGLKNVHMSVRPNDYGISYAALAHVVRMPIARKFEYTIFNEDDYVFTVDNFDRYLVEKLEARPDASYLCACERVYPYDGISHAAVSTGIARTPVLGDLPTSYPKSQIPQVAWSHVLLKRGPIIDWLQDYATAFRLDDDNIRWLERDSADVTVDPFHLTPRFRQALLAPIQVLDRIERGETPFVHYWRDGYVRRPAILRSSGELFLSGEETP